MKMSEKMALRLHLMMWGDMQKELGDKPTCRQRREFKEKWCEENFPDTIIDSSCWLCEYVVRKTDNHDCSKCPIVWGSYNGPTCQCNLLNYYNVNYQDDPISKILALPARNPELQYIVDSFNAKGEYVDKIKHDCYAQGRTAADKEHGRFKQQLAVESGIGATEGVVRHAEALRKQGYDQAAKAFAEQLDAAFKRGLGEAMEKILKGEIQSDTSKKLEVKGYNRACEDICKEAGVQTSYISYGIVTRVKEIGWSECKQHIINSCNIAGADCKDFCSDILARYKNQVIEETLKTYFVDHPQAKYWCQYDVDQAFKQYAAEHSKLLKGKLDTALTTLDYVFDTLSESSGLPDGRTVGDHILAIQNNERDKVYKELMNVFGK